MSSPLRHTLELEHDAGLREQLRAADVVFVVDYDGHEKLFHGRAALEFVVSIGESQNMSVLRLAIDSRTTQLEYLVAALIVLKGVAEPDGWGRA